MSHLKNRKATAVFRDGETITIPPRDLLHKTRTDQLIHHIHISKLQPVVFNNRSILLLELDTLYCHLNNVLLSEYAWYRGIALHSKQRHCQNMPQLHTAVDHAVTDTTD